MRVQDVSPGKAPGKGTQVCLGSAPTSVQATERAPDQAGRGRSHARLRLELSTVPLLPWGS